MFFFIFYVEYTFYLCATSEGVINVGSFTVDAWIQKLWRNSANTATSYPNFRILNFYSSTMFAYFMVHSLQRPLRQKYAIKYQICTYSISILVNLFLPKTGQNATLWSPKKKLWARWPIIFFSFLSSAVCIDSMEKILTTYQRGFWM